MARSLFRPRTTCKSVEIELIDAFNLISDQD